MIVRPRRRQRDKPEPISTPYTELAEHAASYYAMTKSYLIQSFIAGAVVGGSLCYCYASLNPLPHITEVRVVPVITNGPAPVVQQ